MIIYRIREWARIQPDAAALVWNDHTVSYAKFWELISAAKQHFASHGLRPGGTAIVLIPALAHGWVAVLALRWLGLDTVAVDSPELAEEIGISDPECVVVGDRDETIVAAVTARFGPQRVVRMPSRLSGAGPRDSDAMPDPAPGRHILLTSGTTGRRKRVALDNATETQRNASWASALQFERSTAFHGLGYPLFTGVGYLKPSAVWHQGGKVILDQRRNAFASVDSHGATSVVVVPAMMPELAAHLESTPARPRTFQLWVAGGFLPLARAERVSRLLGRPIGVYYASTEIGTITLNGRFASVEDLVWLTPTGTRELQVVDEDGRPCATDEEGQLRIRRTALDSDRYMDDLEASEAVFRDGFFQPGDMAVRRADGRIRILGRTADVLNIQGRKVPVAPIEQQIQSALGVEEVCVFAGMTLQGAEELAVAVRSAQPIPQRQLDAVARSLGHFPRIRFSVMAEFPRGETGLRKTQRRALRRMLFPS